MPPLRIIFAMFIAFLLVLFAKGNPIIGSIAQNGDDAELASNVPNFFPNTFDWTGAVTAVPFINDGAWVYGLMTGDFVGNYYSSGDALDIDPYAWQTNWGLSDNPQQHPAATPFNLSFQITSITLLATTSNTFLEQGWGILQMTGFDPTISSWEISARKSGNQASPPLARVTYTAIGVAVAEGGTSVTMLGAALVGLFFLRRRIVR